MCCSGCTDLGLCVKRVFADSQESATGDVGRSDGESSGRGRGAQREVSVPKQWEENQPQFKELIVDGR